MRKITLAVFVVAMLAGAALAVSAQTRTQDAGVMAVAGPTPLWAYDNPADAVSSDPVGFFSEVVSRLKSGKYWESFGMGLMLLTFGFQWLTKVKDADGDGVDDEPTTKRGKVRHWFNTEDEGKVLGLGVTALLSTSALMIVAGVGPSWALAKSVGGACVAAMGGYAVIFKFILPLLKKLYAKVF